jgi:hypothetical protein
MTNEINKQDYLQTMAGGMIDVTQNPSTVVDIWPYVHQLVQRSIVLPYILKKQLVEKVYRSSNNVYDHIILPTADKNNFVVLVVDRTAEKIYGYHLLDLNVEYALDMIDRENPNHNG